MIDPLDSLAFAMHANPGVYALLLGSGVSRPAQVPTGWEVTIDLVRKLAALANETPEPDPESWYRTKFGEPPNYSILIDELANTQTERQQLMRPYFEPTAAGIEEGLRQPTIAHRAIAKLVADGTIRVIITTNFDRLIEKALNDAGVEPLVVSSDDQIQGMLPLVHTNHCLIKVHGDYLDTRIRNTANELATYSEQLNALLNQIFNDFGLLVCGWSGDWDLALTKALFRATSRRFTTYWTVHNTVTDQAQRLITHRAAQRIDIVTADSFFETLQQKLESISTFSTPHHLSTEIAVTSLKRYIAEPRYQIPLADLVTEITDRVVATIESLNFDINDPNINSTTVTKRARAYEASCSTLTAMASVAGAWAEKHHFHVWQGLLERLASPQSESGKSIWIGLQRYPATLELYALGIGAVASNRLDFLGHLFSTTIYQSNRQPETLAQVLPPYCLFQLGDPRAFMQLLEGMERRYMPLNDWINMTLRPYFSKTIANDHNYDLIFDRMEVLLGMSYAHHCKGLKRRYWAPLGSYIYRGENRHRVLNDIDASVSTLQDESPFVMAGIFGHSPAECAKSIEQFRDFTDRIADSLH